jgi:uncharacterized RDD family membrane protein YckC
MFITGLAIAALTGVSLTAQTSTPQTTPTPVTQPTPAVRPTPTIVPRIDQRYEKPGQPPTGRRVELPDLEELRIYRPVLRIGQPYVLKVTDTAREVHAVMADVRIEGHVEGDVVVVLGDVTLTETAAIDGALVVVAGSVHAPAGAKVGRELVLIGGDLDAPTDFVPQGEHVVVGTAALGRALRAFAPWITRGLLWGRIIVPGLGWMWPLVGVLFVLGLVLNLLFNKPVAACADTLGRRPLSTFLTGLLTLALLPIVLVILAASVVGLVVVPFAIAAFIVAVLVGRISVTRALGRVVMGESDSASGIQATRSFVIGAALIVFAYMVPIVGLLTWMFVGSFGLGSAVLTFFASVRRERPPAAAKPVPPPAPPLATVEPSAAFVPPTPGPVAYESAVPLVADVSAPQAAAAPEAPRPAPSAPPAAGGDLTFYPRAMFLDRLAALALDLVLVGIASAFLGFGRYQGPGPFFLLLFLYHVAFWSWKGTTLGGIICSLRVVRTNNAPMRFIDALVRGLSGIFSFVALGIGFLWMLGDAERQTWHDKIAGTVVVKLPRELVLE